MRLLREPAEITLGLNTYDHAIVTALLGAIVWTVAGALVGSIPLVGPLIALVAYIGVINWRYASSWTAAAMIGLLVWLTVLAVLYVLAVFGVTGFEATGVPGT